MADPELISSNRDRIVRAWYSQDKWLHVQVIMVLNDNTASIKELGISPSEWRMLKAMDEI